MKKIFSLFILIISIFFCLHASADEFVFDCGADVPYQQAIIRLYFAVVQAAQDITNKEEIVAWADDTADRLPEFIDDMVSVTELMSQQPLLSANIEPVEQFLDKWVTIISSCPGCDELGPLFYPILEECLSQLPNLRKASKSDAVPLQNYYEWYGAMEAVNPWGIGGLFHLERTDNEVNELVVEELSREVTRFGIKKTFVVRRETIEKNNGVVTFQELIKNDRVIDITFSLAPITVLHEALQRMIAASEDPEVIASLEDVVTVIDDELTDAWENSILNKYSYYFLYNQEPIKNDIIHARHPLLKNPYNKVYKVAEFYPRDDNQELLNETNPSSIASVQKTFDQPIIPPKVTLAPSTQPIHQKAQKIINYYDGYIQGTGRLMDFWSHNIFAPICLFGLLAFFKRF